MQHNIKLRYVGTCSDPVIANIAAKGGRRFSYKRLVLLVKKQYPHIYEKLALEFYNPWESQSCKIKHGDKFYVNLIHSMIDHLFEIIEE